MQNGSQAAWKLSGPTPELRLESLGRCWMCLEAASSFLPRWPNTGCVWGNPHPVFGPFHLVVGWERRGAIPRGSPAYPLMPSFCQNLSQPLEGVWVLLSYWVASCGMGMAVEGAVPCPISVWLHEQFPQGSPPNLPPCRHQASPSPCQ